MGTKKNNKKENGSSERKQPTPSLYISECSLENIRCFGKEQKISFKAHDQEKPARWTLIIGENGTGKTTILQAIAYKVIERNLILISLLRFANASFPRISTKPYNTKIEMMKGPAISQEGEYKKRNYEDNDRFLLCTYGTNRQTNSSLSDNGEIQYNPESRLFEGVSQLRSIENELLKLQLLTTIEKEKEAANKKIEVVKKLLLSILPKGNISDIDFQKSGSGVGVFAKENGNWLRLNQLALGYASTIAWVGDLLFCLMDFYPESEDPTKEAAIVLLDEIDLHLHPKWQREIKEYLVQAFPNVQFIVTSHSPIIAQASMNENVVLLKKEGDRVIVENEPESFYGLRVDQILTSEFFGLSSARPKEVEELMEERRKLILKNKLTKEEKEKLKRLEENLDRISEGESIEDIKAREFITQAAKDIRQKLEHEANREKKERLQK